MEAGITFILCSRNDAYMGNPVGRLELALNFLAENVRLAGRADQVEVMVTDWGSAVPLKDVLHLNATAVRLTRFIEVPVSVVKEMQQDSPFAEVLALNAAVRRATGVYIGRIDQDTLVGEHFIRTFFSWIEGRSHPGFEVVKSCLFCRRRQISFDFASRDPSLDQVTRYLRWCGKWLWVEALYPFFHSPVGIMLLHRQLWLEAGGYDERLIYWGWMEVDLAYRLAAKFPLVDIGELVKCDFYHLEHYDPKTPRVTPRRTNLMKKEGLLYHPNQESWGLVDRNLPMTRCFLPRAPGASPHASAKQLSVFNSITRAGLSYARWQIFRLFRAIASPEKYRDYLKRIIGRVSRQRMRQ